jgi:L-fuconate dehydratase
MSTIVSVDTRDIRFPTSLELDGSDAMNPDPDYSAAYIAIRTDAADGHVGHGFVFTIGRGNDVQVAALDALRGHLVGRDVDELLGDMGGTWRLLAHDSQLRWLGPEKGVMHMAIGAAINALWDLRAKRAALPLWQLLAGLSPEELVSLVDFRYLSDAITPDEALALFRAAEPRRTERIEQLLATGYPAYTTTPGWLGYSDEKLDRLCREAVADGLTRSSTGSAAKPSPMDSPRSSSRSEPTSPTIAAGSVSPAPRWAPASRSRSMRTSAGTSTRRSSG